MWREALQQFLSSGSKRRTLGIGYEVIHCQVLSIGLQPTKQRSHILGAFGRLDGAEQRVLEYPVEQKGRFLSQEVDALKRRFHFRRLGPLPRKPHGAGRDIITKSLEP